VSPNVPTVAIVPTAPPARPVRPRLTVKRSAPPAAPTLARSKAPPAATRPTTGRSLAAATGAPLVEEPSGLSTVRLGPADPTPTIARADTFETAEPPTSALPVVVRSAAPAEPAIARAKGGGGASGDSYDQFVERLRRDLLREREQYGDLLGDLPW
jgi:hypothetical protein